MDRWGSHWRWRLALVVAVVTLIGARYVVARSWKHRELVIKGGGPAAVIRSSSLGRSAIETWDWRNGETQTLVELASDATPEGMCLAGDRAEMELAAGSI